jgi:hypothetical protein
MYTDIPTLGAPIMIAGLAIGFFLCFYGSKARGFLLPLRSIFSGALLSLSLALLLLNGSEVISALAGAEPYLAIKNLLLRSSENYTHPLIYLISFSAGGLLMFFLSRKQKNSIGVVLKILTGLSMGLAIFLLLRSMLILSLSLLISSVALFFILYLCLRGFDYYFALETALAGALIVSYLITRFWYLAIWMFFIWTILLTIVGILTQIHSLKKSKREQTKTNE